MNRTLYARFAASANRWRQKNRGAWFTVTRTSQHARGHRGRCLCCGQTVAAGTDRSRVLKVTRDHAESCIGEVVHYRRDCSARTSEHFWSHILDLVTCVECRGLTATDYHLDIEVKSHGGRRVKV